MKRLLSARRVNVYVAKEIWAPFGLTLAAFSFILLMDKIVRLTELVINKRVDILQVTRLFIFLLPSFLIFTIPVAALLATVIAFGRLSSDHEITALKASGISLYQLLPAVATFAVTAFALGSFLTLFLAPASNWAFKSLLFQITRTKASIGIKERIFNDDFRGLTIYVNSVTVDGVVLKGVMISDDRDAKQANLIVADRGFVIANKDNLTLTMRLEKGSVHRTSRDLQTYQKIDFSSYDLNLDLDEMLVRASKGSKGLSDMALGELKEKIQTLRSVAQTVGLYETEVEYHRKFALAFSSLFFPFIGMPLGVQSRRAGRLSGFTLGLGVLFLYYLFVTGAEQLALRGSVPSPVSLWAANSLFLGGGIYLFVITAQELELSAIEQLGRAWETVQERLRSFFYRLRKV